MKEVIVFKAHDNYVLTLQFSSGGQTLISGGMDSLIRLWNVADWEQQKVLDGHENSVNSLALSPDDSSLLSGSTDATLKRWLYPSGELLQTYTDRKKTVASVRYSPDGNWVAGAFYGGRAAVWNLDNEPVITISASKKNLGVMAFSPDGSTLALGGLGDDISLWSLPIGERLNTLVGHRIAITYLQYSHDGSQLISMGYDQTIRFWDTKTWESVRIVQPEPPAARGLLLSPDEQQVAISMEGRIQFWNVASWTLETEFEAGAKVVSSMAFSPDGGLFVTGGADKKIRVWDLS